MALVSAGNNSDRVDHGSAAGLDNLATGTILLWIRPADVTNSTRVIFSKWDTANGWVVHRLSGDGSQMRFNIDRATAALIFDTATGFLATDTWQYIAIGWDVAGNTADIYSGSLSALAVEASYAQETGGSGAQNNDAALTVKAFNYSGNALSFPGRIASVQIYNRKLTLGEIQLQQFRPHPMSGALLYTQYGFAGTGTQPDWSGNGNNGTVTGATVADHVPLGPLFGFDRGWMGAFKAVGQGRLLGQYRNRLVRVG